MPISLRAPAALTAFLLVAWTPAYAAGEPPASGRGPGLCQEAAIHAALRNRVPPPLLTAMVRVESAGAPYAIGLGPRRQALIAADLAGAIAAVQSEARRGFRSIDVGCLQVNLREHPNAFPSLAHAFHPDWNAEFGARLLRRLYEKHGSWQMAVAHYHSPTRYRQALYICKVIVALGQPHPACATPPGGLEKRPLGRIERAERLPADRASQTLAALRQRFARSELVRSDGADRAGAGSDTSPPLPRGGLHGG